MGTSKNRAASNVWRRRQAGGVVAWVAVAVLTVGVGVVRAQPSEKVPAFEEPRVFTGVVLRPYGVASADFNADGYPDVVVAVRGGEYGGDSIGSIVIFTNLGVDANDAWLGFAEPVRYWLDLEIETKPYHLVVGNIDPSNDPLGLPDIVVSAFDSDEVFVFLNDWTDPGSFGLPDRYSLPSNFAPRGIALGRFCDTGLFIDVARGNELDIQPLNCTGSMTTVRAGQVLDMAHLSVNATNFDPPGRTYTYTWYLSDNEYITTDDTPLTTRSTVWDRGAMGAATFVSTGVLIPANTPAGTYWIGVIYDAGTDGVPENNAATTWDAHRTTVTTVGLP